MAKSINETRKNNFFEKFANAATKFTGSSAAFISATAIVVIWALSGPIFKYSETWQLVINTGTTIITFLMVFIIQNTQNRDTVAIQLKLDELIRATKGAHNMLLDIEELEQGQLDEFKLKYQTLADLARKGLLAGETDTDTPEA